MLLSKLAPPARPPPPKATPVAVAVAATAGSGRDVVCTSCGGVGHTKRGCGGTPRVHQPTARTSGKPSEPVRTEAKEAWWRPTVEPGAASLGREVTQATAGWLVTQAYTKERDLSWAWSALKDDFDKPRKREVNLQRVRALFAELIAACVADGFQDKERRFRELSAMCEAALAAGAGELHRVTFT